VADDAQRTAVEIDEHAPLAGADDDARLRDLQDLALDAADAHELPDAVGLQQIEDSDDVAHGEARRSRLP
jgi:hypothetical protein